MSPWVRIDENAMDHPKFLALSDGAWRLWCEGQAYCQKHLTDGRIDKAALKGFRYYSPSRLRVLTSTLVEGKGPCWHQEPDGGVIVHAYLEWNDSRTAVMSAREEGRARKRRWIDRQNEALDAFGTRSSTRSSLRGVECRDLSGSSEKKERAENEEPFTGVEPPGDPSDPAERAGAFLERYKALHVRLRKGAHYIGKPHLDFQEALQLVAVFDDPTLDKLAYVWLNTDHDFAQNGTRTIAKFRSMCSWCEEQLIAFEQKHGPLQVAS
jgi:hypothetical protein